MHWLQSCAVILDHIAVWGSYEDEAVDVSDNVGGVVHMVEHLGLCVLDVPAIEPAFDAANDELVVSNPGCWFDAVFDVDGVKGVPVICLFSFDDEDWFG